MPKQTYGMFCPIAMACEIIEPRWTLLILTEMWCGATRFNDIKRGVPGISPTLLSRRLKEMESRRLIERLEDPARGTVDYVRTPLAIELEPVLDLLGDWSLRHVEPDVALERLKPDYLMWNMHRKIDQSSLPERRSVVRFHFSDCEQSEASWWVVSRPGTPVNLCLIDPKFDVDLYVESSLRSLGSAWMGYTSLAKEISEENIFLSGDPVLARTIDKWLIKQDGDAAECREQKGY